MPLFGAFVRALVCWCSECGQAARTEEVGARFLEEAGGQREGSGQREGLGLCGGPLLQGGRRGRGPQRG